VAQSLANGLVAGLLYALLGVSLAIAYAPSRFYNFAHGAAVTIAPYVMISLTMSGFSILAAAPIAIAASVLIGALSELVVFRRIRSRGGDSLSLLLCSVGLYIVLENAIALLWDQRTRSAIDLIPSQEFRTGALVISVHQMLILAVVPMTIAGAWLWLKFSGQGRVFRAVSSDAQLAECVGISGDRAILIGLAVGAGLAGIGGLLFALRSNVSPHMGQSAMTQAIVCMIVGGPRNVFGSVLAGVMIGLSEHLVSFQFGQQWQSSVAFVLLILVLVFRRAPLSQQALLDGGAR